MTNPQTSAWTVIGVWINDYPMVAGVVIGDHPVYGDDGSCDGTNGLWATTAEAEDAETATQLAQAEMLTTLETGA